MAENENSSAADATPFWLHAWKPLAVAVAVHLAIILGYSAFFGFNLSCFVNVGSSFQWADKEHFAPGTVKYTHLSGYDACDYYMVALDPFLLNPDIAPTYKSQSKFVRYQRFVYPALIHLIAAGRPRFFPLAMVFINVASMVGITIVLMRMLMRRGASPWLSLIFVLGPGMLFGFWLDLQMHLCFFMIVAALDLYERKRMVPSALLFALAFVTWESAVLVAGPLGLWELIHRRWKNVICLALVPVPFLVSQAYFAHQLGAKLFSGSPMAINLPLVGIVRAVVDLTRVGPSQGFIRYARQMMVVPALLLFLAMLVLTCWKLWRKRNNLYAFMLFAQLLFILILDKRVLDTFVNATRINAGIFLPFALCYRDQKEKISPWLFVWVMGLAALAVLRIFSGVREPYILIGAG
ncbi:MAG: hypothetical protein GXP25_18610 [Planctomycetes bacterium]|nr:hypothetical protein [Planctomycetota bacterium]